MDSGWQAKAKRENVLKKKKTMKTSTARHSCVFFRGTSGLNLRNVAFPKEKNEMHFLMKKISSFSRFFVTYMHRHCFREFKTISMHCIINVGDRSRPHDCSVCWVVSTGHMPQVKSIQVTAPALNYQTTDYTLDLIEYFVKRLELGDTFNAVCLSVSWWPVLCPVEKSPGTVSCHCACTKLWFLDRMSRNQKMRGE